MKAVEVIMENGVPEDRIIFINLVRSLSIQMAVRKGTYNVEYGAL